MMSADLVYVNDNQLTGSLPTNLKRCTAQILASVNPRLDLNCMAALTQWARGDILMSWGKNCRETIFFFPLSRNYPHCGSNFESGKQPSLAGERQLGCILGDKLGEGNCESEIVSRQWGNNFLPRDIKMSRRALWAIDFYITELVQS